MILPFSPGQHLLDVVETADAAAAKMEWDDAIRSRFGGGSHGVEPATERLVHRVLERPAPPFHRSIEQGGNIVVQRQGGSHDLMLLF